MEIIECLSNDLKKQLFALYSATWFTQNRSEADIEKMLKNSYLTLGFVIEGKLVGFCRAISDGVYKAFLFDVIVHDDYQNKGFGKLMVKTIMEHKSLNNVKHIELYCPEKVSGFYSKLGFEKRTSLLLRYTR